MPTVYNDQFYVIDPFDPPPAGTTLATQRFDLRDNNDDGDIDSRNADRVDGSDVRESYPGDTVTVTLPNGTDVTYTGITFYLADGREVFTPTDGQVLQSGTLVSTSFVNVQGPLLVGDLGPPCLTRGTPVETAKGPVPVEALLPGDLVLTHDNGLQPLLWLGATTLRAQPRHAPVRIEAGALGNAVALSVSPQHRMLVSGWQAELLFGRPEVLVPALHLAGLPGIRREAPRRVTYFHVLLERHEIIRTAGTWSESYHPATSLERHADEIRKALPERFAGLASAMRCAPIARPQVTGREARALLAA
jgi:hypothetical protein